MITKNDITTLAKNGITFKLSNDGRFANMYYNGKFVDGIHYSNNRFYICSKSFVIVTCKEILEFLRTNNCDIEVRKDFGDQEIFEIWKKSIMEGRGASTFDKEYNRSKGYTYYHFKRLGLPKSEAEKDAIGSAGIQSLLQQSSYEDALKILQNLKENV